MSPGGAWLEQQRGYEEVEMAEILQGRGSEEGSRVARCQEEDSAERLQ